MNRLREYLPVWLTSIRLPPRQRASGCMAALSFARRTLAVVRAYVLAILLAIGLATAGADPVGVMAQVAPNCVELIVNGSFEQTSTGWDSVAGSSLFAYANDQAVDGRHSLLLGFSAPFNMPATFGVEQLVTLPADSTRIDIGFAYAVVTEGGADEGDQAYLTIHDAENNQLLAMLVFSPTDGTWNLGRYDLTPLAGKEIRLAFMTQNDEEPGQLAMRVDDVSIAACLPPEAFALEALPVPALTAVPPTPEMMVLTPAAPVPDASAGLPPSQMPPASEVFPPAALIESLAQCSCARSLYTCSSFSSWAVAQACYTQCQVAAGYDIHDLDPDRNGVACELELQDVAPLDAMPSPQPTPLLPTEPISETNSTGPDATRSGPSLPITGTGALTGPASLPTVAGEVVISGAITLPLAAGVVTTNSTHATDTVAVALAPPTATVSSLDAPVVSPSALATSPASELSPIAMLSLLLLSPLGYLAIGVIVVIGALSLWVAFLLGQRGHKANESPAVLSSPTNSNTSTSVTSAAANLPPDDYTLLPNKGVSAPKS